jgi:arylsulfatase A-like enzyme
VAVAGGKVPAGLDGVDLVPYLAGRRREAPHDTLYWRFGPSRAVRRGDWKLLSVDNETWELYNVRNDAGEKNDLAASEPDRVTELKAAFEAWNAQLAAPRWKPNRNRPAGRGLRGGQPRRRWRQLP